MIRHRTALEALRAAHAALLQGDAQAARTSLRQALRFVASAAARAEGRSRHWAGPKKGWMYSGKPGNRGGARPTVREPEDDASLRELHAAGWSLAAMAEELLVSKSTVRRWLAALGLPAANPGARRLVQTTGGVPASGRTTRALRERYADDAERRERAERARALSAKRRAKNTT